MNAPLLTCAEPILLVGGGDSPGAQLAPLLARCETRVAADGGAETLLRAGAVPDAVIGDLDSLSQGARAQIPDARVHHIAEQDSTDFDKCLRNIAAPLVFGIGFLGPRVDHQLAALTVLTRRADRRCILVGEADAIALAPPRITLSLPVGLRFSLYPMGLVRGESTGLRWPLGGLDFTPAERAGTSNETSAETVSLRVDAPLMLIILPVRELPELARALLSAPDEWPARVRG